MTTSRYDQRPAGSAIHPILRHNIRLDRIVYLPIDNVKTYARKLRKRAKGAIEAIEASIKGFGIVSPILVDQHGTIIAGEAIVEAARRIGYDEIPTIRIDHLDKTEVRFLRIALNKLATTSSWDEIELGAEFGELLAIETELAYPRTFLDFETIQFAIPRWLGTRPFEQVPFQWSAHIATADGTVAHHEFLSIDGDDPRRACAERLARLPSNGAVIAWNASFERGCLLGLAALFPDLAPALTSLAIRLVDLLLVTRRHYYHRDMRGSWSIKAVLPTLGVPGYDELGEVRSGIDAQAGYLEAIDSATGGQRREELRIALLAYCERDTEAMLLVLDRLTRPAAAGAA